MPSSRRSPLLVASTLFAVMLGACTTGVADLADIAEEPTEDALTAAEVEVEAAPAATTTSIVDEPADEQVATATDAQFQREVQRAEQEAQAARLEAEAEMRRHQETMRVQEVLAANVYYAGAIDGEAGPATTAAVMAFQKVHGLSRDGVIGPQTLGAIESPQAPRLVGGNNTRIEIDLDRQVVHLVVDGRHVRTMNASSGNGKVYTWPDGRVARADTPVGVFSIQRRISGLREGDLGSMYDPLYFHHGWAIHGSNSVPGYPASHGCVRLSRADALWLAAQIPNGTQVVVHGSVNAFDPRTESVWL